jgi:mannosyl-oligosaccharide alpha-1,2-mannosidase
VSTPTSTLEGGSDESRNDIARKPRAPRKGVAAELGSLTLEFTRLAQITKNNKYFDAVQRITDALDAYQLNTSIPGLWPEHIDTSGCKPVRPTSSRVTANDEPPTSDGVFANPDSEAKSETEPAVPASKDGITVKPFRVPAVLGGTGKEVPQDPNPLKIVAGKRPVTAAEGVSEQPIAMPAVVGGTGKEVPQDTVAVPNVESEHIDDVTETTTMPDSTGGTGHEFPEHELARSNFKRKVETGNADDDNTNIDASPKKTATPTYTPTRTPGTAKCVSRGLAVPPFSKEEKYSLGAMIDSLYEYLIKEYLLLGGVKAADQYKRMYSTAMDVAGEKLTFRPNVEGSPDVLIPGKIYVERIGGTARSAAEGSHLVHYPFLFERLTSNSLGLLCWRYVRHGRPRSEPSPRP